MRENILMGKLPLPSREVFIANIGQEVTEVVEKMFNSIWHNYLAKLKGSSTIYWLEQAGKQNTKKYLSALASLQASGWITLDTRDNFSSISLNTLKLLEFVTQQELDDLRYNRRFNKYLPFASQEEYTPFSQVYANGKPTNRMLPRPGMQKGARTQFSFDRNALVNNFDIISKEVRKGIENTLAKHPQMAQDTANYSEVVDGILQYLAKEDAICDMGTNNVDSRGRAIKSNLDKVMNPIGYKVARALLVIPE